MPEMILDDGWVVPYRDSGSGEPIVLVLGSADSLASAFSVASVTDVGHRLLLVDVDALTDGRQDVGRAARHLRSLLGDTGLRGATLIGHSHACPIVARVAAEDDAGLVARLALVSSRVTLPAAPDLTVGYGSDLSRVTVPILVLHSEVDAEAPLRQTAMGAVFAAPRARLRVYPGSQHGLRDGFRESVIRDILDFAAEP